MSTGIKHLITCRCILQQFKNLKNPPQHQFVVFSELKDDDSINHKFVQCNNCGLVHKVIDICKSEIVNKESLSSIQSLDEIKCSIPDKLVTLLEKYNVDMPTWEHVSFIVNNEKWGEYVHLASDVIDDMIQGKILILYGKGLFKIENFVKENIL